MADPTTEQLLAEFKAAFEAGERPSLAETLERASPDQRQALAAEIDSFVMSAPRREWDPVAYESSIAKQSVERVWESLEGVSGSWPELLPHLRHKARIKRSELVARLSEALGVPDRREKVATYFNRMEHGQLPARGISERVFEALAAILGTEAAAIRDAGAAGGRPEAGAQVAFARTALTDADYADDALADAEAPAPAAEAGRDEVDELFTGG